MFGNGSCVDLPRQTLAIEKQLAERLGLPISSVCLVHHDPQLALVALAEAPALASESIAFLWQQLSNAPLTLLQLQTVSRLPLPAPRSDASDWLQQLLVYSLQQQASDIHLEPQPEGLKIRLRVAGQLLTAQHLSRDQGRQLCARVKVLADLDITEHFKPQDGRFSVTCDAKHSRDFRVSCCPVLDGEKLVIRCLGTLQQLPSLSQLGLAHEQLQCITRCLGQTQGLILVTGPTGSGKTSTLYSMLQRLNHRSLNICTVEDPVEIRFPGINQVPVNPHRQLSFAVILRTLLRQDPDVLLVGEIRDAETAQVALQAAQTGHLVFATLHTNSAVDSLTRLAALGLPYDEISTALLLLVSQRLLRKLCPDCTGTGCRQCDQGYLGQLAAFEVIPWQHRLLEQKLAPDSISSHLANLHLPTLQQHGQQLVKRGLTSVHQARRLVFNRT